MIDRDLVKHREKSKTMNSAQTAMDNKNMLTAHGLLSKEATNVHSYEHTISDGG